MMRNTLAFSLRALRRDWRAGELRILSIALIIAVGGLTTVGFFIDRVQQAMRLQANELLAADLVLVSSEPIAEARRERAREMGLRTARTLAFRSVTLAEERMQLVELKAVSNAYPLRGSLRLADAPFVDDAPTRSIPPRGEVWVTAPLLQALAIDVSGMVKLGHADFRVGKVLTYEPDRGGELFNIAPRVLMNIDDVAATRLIQRGSRVRHKLLVAGEPSVVQAFATWLSSRPAVTERVLTLEEGRPELRVALERAQQFLGLAALVSVLLAGVAIAMAARRYADRHLDTSAIMRCLGATQATIVRVFALEIIWLGLAASLVGCVLGYLAHLALTGILAGLVASALPAPSLRPLFVAVPVGLAVLAGFALPPLLALRHVPPTRVLRHDVGRVSTGSMLTYGAAMLTMTALMAWQAHDLRLFAWVAGGTVMTLLVLGAAALLLVRGLQRLRGRVGIAWRFGFANIARRARGSAAQIVAFGLAVMVLLLLSMVRGDLLAGWRDTMPARTPNNFLINIQPDQVAALREFLAAGGIDTPTLHPMVRARLVAVNERPVSAEHFSDDHAKRHARREFNLSWATTLQVDNRVVAGRWWGSSEHGQPLISFEEGLAQTLGIKLGDLLKYNIAGTEIALHVSNLRVVDWDTFNVNFFAILPPGVLEAFPATYVTSFYLPTEDKGMLASLVKEFPNVTVIDVGALMSKVRLIMERASAAIEYVFLFTVLAGLAVLYAAIQTTQDERRYESAVLRILGARRQQLLRGLLAEFVTLGMLGGTVAGLAATALGYVLAEHVFHFPYQFNPWIWVFGWMGGTVGIGVAGVLGARHALHQPPAKTLREV
jgi:putative ABC transport system permease protein